MPFALDQATTTTIVSVAIWFVLFPGFVTALVVFAIVQARGEGRSDQETRSRSQPPDRAGQA